MARVGQVIENARRKETVRFVRVADAGGGGVLEMWVEAGPTTASPPRHAHPLQEERFSVVRGEVTLEVEGRVRVAGAGETVVIPSGAVHTWWNAGPEDLAVKGELEPALRFETFLETIYGLQRVGRTNAEGIPNKLQAAVIFDEFAAEWVPAFLPVAVRKLAIPVLAVAGRAAGYRPWYPEFSPEGPVAVGGGLNSLSLPGAPR